MTLYGWDGKRLHAQADVPPELVGAHFIVPPDLIDPGHLPELKMKITGRAGSETEFWFRPYGGSEDEWTGPVFAKDPRLPDLLKRAGLERTDEPG